MLRLLLSVLILVFVFRYLLPRLKVTKILWREWRARYNRAEWEKIRRELEKK
ncbi:MAG: hypothetical protein HYY14_04725 [Candidatus Omnitrophica bacterium]|nr:hypothetical protein [Candidatus Omnitrophota bacterium]